VEAILATTNLVNGSFAGPGGRRVTVFAAEWTARDGQSMSVVQHTPDVCWVSGGWLPVRLGQPEQVEIEIAGRRLPFECRVFGGPGGFRKELVVWCTLVGGQVLAEPDRWVTETDATVDRGERFVIAGRRMATGQFLDNVRNRRKASGEKRFVRLSAPVDGEWPEALEELRRFAPGWIAVSDAGK